MSAAGAPRVKTREERWSEEAAFFDRAAQGVDTASLVLDPIAFGRYTRPKLRRRFSKEYRFHLLGDLQGRTLLDVGCGDGLNAVMMARMGARVTGVDVSPGALDLARRRAEVNGVADRVRFLCAPIEQAALPPREFDIVWGDGILHHVLDDLDAVVRCLVRCAKPGGLILFAEPVNLSAPLRRLRRLVPVHTESTPGERPMVASELALVRRHVPDLRIRHYALFGRVDRFVLVSYNYERSSPLRRAIVSGIDLVDWALLSVPAVRNLGSTCVMHGHAPVVDPNDPARNGTRPRESHEPLSHA